VGSNHGEKIMSLVRQIATKSYQLYLEKSKGQLSPEDALWITEQYLTDNPEGTIDEAVTKVFDLLIQSDY
jgi:hypothetical protein